MTTASKPENHHGVLMNLSGHGVFIIGQAGIGKSSLALELLHHGYRLIADDVAEFTRNNDACVIGTCPDMLEKLLHCRELGVIPVTDHFGANAWQPQVTLKYIIHLQKNVVQPSTITPELRHYIICKQAFPMLVLDISTPASLHHRIMTWLAMQATNSHAESILIQRQQNLMIIQ